MSHLPDPTLSEQQRPPHGVGDRRQPALPGHCPAVLLTHVSPRVSPRPGGVLGPQLPFPRLPRLPLLLPEENPGKLNSWSGHIIVWGTPSLSEDDLWAVGVTLFSQSCRGSPAMLAKQTAHPVFLFIVYKKKNSNS